MRSEMQVSVELLERSLSRPYCVDCCGHPFARFVVNAEYAVFQELRCTAVPITTQRGVASLGDENVPSLKVVGVSSTLYLMSAYTRLFCACPVI